MNILFLTENLISTISEIVDNAKGSVDAILKPYDIAFPHLNIFISGLRNTFKIGNFTIAYYGVIIAFGMLIAFYVASKSAKKLNISDDIVYDLFIICVICGIIGARVYYVIFRWDYYQIRPYEILDIRAGGLAVFGGIILSVVGIYVYCLIKKINFFKIIDIVAFGVVVGQAIGRYGNFFNMEAFGGYTDNIFAMRMRTDYLDQSNITFDQALNVIEENGLRYIQAHPTFFYESTLNIILFLIMVYVFYKFYRFSGQMFATYLIGYGVIRFFVESLRTDSLMFYNFKISQLVALTCIFIGIIAYIINFKKKSTNV